MIGSIVQFSRRRSIIWGSGIISDTSEVPRPDQILATRGPLSRQRFLSKEIHCPEVYGDPAILLPLFYQPPKSKKKWALGVIPHYVDKSCNIIERLMKTPGVHIIDIETDDIEGFISELHECRAIISSSLHGIIVAETYGIPAGWLTLSNKLTGGRFKFDDYYQSTGRKNIQPINLEPENIQTSEIIRMLPTAKPSYDKNKLLTSCPFYTPK